MSGGSVLPGCPTAGLVVVHEDPWCVVLDKPPGLLSVPGRGPDKQDCLAARAQRRWPDAQVVHRLDMATSGLWLMARGAAMQRAFSRLFETRQVRKRYVALVGGCLPAGGGWQAIDLPLAADWPNRPRQVVDPAGGKPSRTRWRVLSAGPDRTRVALEPLTGRTHQLRVHMQALGHPILGDALYGPPQPAADRLMLHASALVLVHPATAEPLRLRSQVPF